MSCPLLCQWHDLQQLPSGSRELSASCRHCLVKEHVYVMNGVLNTRSVVLYFIRPTPFVTADKKTSWCAFLWESHVRLSVCLYGSMFHLWSSYRYWWNLILAVYKKNYHVELHLILLRTGSIESRLYMKLTQYFQPLLKIRSCCEQLVHNMT
jgi:hypothetical protein